MTLLAVVLRIGVSRGIGGLELNVIFRITCGAFALFYLLSEFFFNKGFSLPSLGLVGFSFVASIFFWSSGFASINALRFGPLGASWTILRLAMIIPMLASILFWHEISIPPANGSEWRRVLGIVFTIAAVVLIGNDHVKATQGHMQFSRSDLKRWVFWVAVSFLSQGLWEVSLKVSGGWADDSQRKMFVSVVMIFSLLLSIPIGVMRRRKITRATLVWGALAGFCSLLASGLRPWALKELPGVVVFPVTAVAVTALVILAGVVFWKEKMGKLGWAGIASAMLGIVLAIG